MIQNSKRVNSLLPPPASHIREGQGTIPMLLTKNKGHWLVQELNEKAPVLAFPTHYQYNDTFSVWQAAMEAFHLIQNTAVLVLWTV